MQLQNRVDKLEQTLDRLSIHLTNRQPLSSAYSSYAAIPEFHPSYAPQRPIVQEANLTAITKHVDLVYNLLNDRLENIERKVDYLLNEISTDSLSIGSSLSGSLNKRPTTEIPNNDDSGRTENAKSSIGTSSGCPISKSPDRTNQDDDQPSSPTQRLPASGLNSMFELSNRTKSTDTLNTKQGSDCIFASLDNLNAFDYLNSRTDEKSKSKQNSFKELVYFGKKPSKKSVQSAKSLVENPELKRVKSEPNCSEKPKRKCGPKRFQDLIYYF